MKTIASLIIITGLSTLAACGDDHGHETVDDEGCEHLAEGPAQAVTAAPTDQGAPAVNDDHKRYDITLVDVPGGKGGTVTFAASEETEYVFFFDADVPIEITAAGGAAVTLLDSATSSATCAEIKGRHTARLPVGTYAVKLGPTTATKVGLVVEPDVEHGE